MIRAPVLPKVQAFGPNQLTVRPMGVDSYQEPIIYMRADCPVCRSEGFESLARVQLRGNGRAVIATLNVVQPELLASGEAGLSDAAWRMLGAEAPLKVTISHPEPVMSFRHVRAKLFGHELAHSALSDIINDVAARKYSDVQMSAFLTGCVGERMNPNEIVGLTQAMVAAGQRLDWKQPAVYDKHCVGGLPGNRTTPIIVAIAAACGVVMPKTSSRAITSPAGTADTMAAITKVDLSLAAMRRVVDAEGGCLAWGGSVELSPADDVLIRVERALDVDSEAQLVASVLSKKLAAGSTYALIDIPIGPTAKVRDETTADRLAQLFHYTAAQLGLQVEVVKTDGAQPVGNGIGPALEARDVLAVLRNAPEAPDDLRQRAAFLAGRILETSGLALAGSGTDSALQVLADGRAWDKFQAICAAQGGLREPPLAPHRYQVVAALAGPIARIDNRRLAKAARLAGAPSDPAAGIDLHVRLGQMVERDQAVFTVHAESPGELAYASDYLGHNADLIGIDSSAVEDKS